jgi:hypothetical protein
VDKRDPSWRLWRIKAVIADLKDPSRNVSSALCLLYELAEDLRAEIEDPSPRPLPDLQTRLDTMVAQRDEAIAAADGAMIANLELQGTVATLKDCVAKALTQRDEAIAERASAHRVCDEQHATLKALTAENDTLKAELSHATTARDRKIVAGVVLVVAIPAAAPETAFALYRRDMQNAREFAAAQADRLAKAEYAARCQAERIVKLEAVRDLQAARLDAVLDRLDNLEREAQSIHGRVTRHGDKINSLEHNGEVNRQRIDGHDRTLTLQFGEFDKALREAPRGRVAD